jgi:hypothetical protein
MLLAACAMPPILAAQGAAPAPGTLVGTSTLGAIERLVRVELSLGRELGGSGDPSGTGPLERLVIVAMRVRAAGEPGYRFWALWARRDSSDGKPRARFTVAGVSFDLPLQLGRRLSVAPSYGAGYAIAIDPSASSGMQEERFAPVLGVALRYRRVVVEGQLLVLGGDAFRTVTLGFRI